MSPAQPDVPPRRETAANERARAERALERLPPRLGKALHWLLTRWPGRIVLRSAAGFVRIGIFDRSMTLAAQFFTSVLPILILIATAAAAADTQRLSDTLNIPEESQAVVEDAVQGGAAAFGLIGALMVLVSATSLSRALTRVYVEVWHVARPPTKVSTAWRWVAVVIVLALSLVFVRALIQFARGLPPSGIWQIVVSLACDVAMAVFVPWILLSGALRARHLMPGAFLFALIMLAVRPASAAWLPHSLEVSSDRYGSLGVAFTYLAWLYVISFILIAVTIVGQAMVSDAGRLGVWLRDDQDTVEQPV